VYNKICCVLPFLFPFVTLDFRRWVHRLRLQPVQVSVLHTEFQIAHVLFLVCFSTAVSYKSGGLPGEPKGLKAVRVMFLDLQNSIMSAWTK